MLGINIKHDKEVLKKLLGENGVQCITEERICNRGRGDETFDVYSFNTLESSEGYGIEFWYNGDKLNNLEYVTFVIGTGGMLYQFQCNANEVHIDVFDKKIVMEFDAEVFKNKETVCEHYTMFISREIRYVKIASTIILGEVSSNKDKE